MEIKGPELIQPEGPKFTSHGKLKLEVPESPEFTFEQDGPRFVIPKPLKLVLPEKERDITEIVI
ncbi:hypothetical protein FJZ31_22830 [Candidatus Poribacteria bacterium]|nr:hypothetical protein [Candidatus Poribacteria bacterium]